jgi:predicted Zn-dependent protease
MFSNMAPPSKSPPPKARISLESAAKRGEQIRSLVITGVTIMLAFVVIIGTAISAWNARSEWVVTVATLRVPDTMKPRGLSGEVLAHRLLAQINDIREDGFFVNLDARRRDGKHTQKPIDALESAPVIDYNGDPRELHIDYGTDWSEPKFDIAIPGAGLSFEQATEGVRRLFRAREIVISGDLVVVSGDSKSNGGAERLRITLKIRGLSATRVVQRTFDSAKMDAEMEGLVLQLLAFIDPVALARHYINEGDLSAADTAIDACLAADIRDCSDAEKAQALLLRAGRMHTSGRELAAISVAEEALTKNLEQPDAATAYQILGLAHYSRSEYTPAIAALKQASAADPGSWTTTRVYFNALQRIGHRDEARMVLVAGLTRQVRQALAEASDHANAPALTNALLERQRALTGKLDASALKFKRRLGQFVEGSSEETGDYAERLKLIDGGVRSLASTLSRGTGLRDLQERHHLEACFTDEPTSKWATGKLLYCTHGLLDVYRPEASLIDYEAVYSMLTAAKDRRSDPNRINPAIAAAALSIPWVDRRSGPDIRIVREETDVLDELETAARDDEAAGEDNEKIHWYLAMQYLTRYLARHDNVDLSAAGIQIDRLADQHPDNEKYRAATAALRLMDGDCEGFKRDFGSAEPAWDLLSPSAATRHYLSGQFEACLQRFDLAGAEWDLAAAGAHDYLDRRKLYAAKLEKRDREIENAAKTGDFDPVVAAQLDYTLDAGSIWPDATLRDVELARGKMFEAQAQLANAMNAYQAAHADDPNSEATEAYARMLNQAGRFAEAIDIIQDELSYEGLNAGLLATQGEAELALDRLDQAEASLDAAWQSDSRYATDDEDRYDDFSLRLRVNFGILAVSQKRPAEAIRQFSQVLRSTPEDRRVNAALIALYCSIGRTAEAQSALLSAKAHGIAGLPDQTCASPIEDSQQ